MNLSRTQELFVEKMCLTVVGEMFASFHNPKFRGPNFTWGGFPDLVSNLCAQQIAIHSNSRNRVKMEEYAATFSRRLAAEYVQLMTE